MPPLPDARSGSVFLNVPFDPAYAPAFVTLVATLVTLGQTPRCVLEINETGQGRLTRVFGLLGSCAISIHDLSRTGPPARFNMPFELGIAYALAHLTGAHQICVLDKVPYRLDKTLSDYKGRDPLIYSDLNSLVHAIADVFQLRASDPRTTTVLEKEARFLRKAARTIAAHYGGKLFRPGAFRALVAAASQRAKDRDLIP